MGPRVVASGSLIAQTGGMRAGNEDHAVEITGADEARREARKQLKAGVDVLKIYGASSIGGGGGRLVGPPGWPHLTVEEMRAIVEEAHKADRLSSAHAVSTVSIKNAIRAGVDWVDHADFLDDEAIQMLLDTNTPIVPTQAIAWSLEHFGEDMGFGPHIATKAREVSQVATAALAKAYQAGVTDRRRHRRGQPARLAGAGVPAAHRDRHEPARGDPRRHAGRAAKLLRLDDLVGSIEVGKVADLLLVDGDAARDIAALKRVRDVFQGGKRLELPLVDLRPFGYA